MCHCDTVQGRIEGRGGTSAMWCPTVAPQRPCLIAKECEQRGKGKINNLPAGAMPPTGRPASYGCFCVQHAATTKTLTASRRGKWHSNVLGKLEDHRLSRTQHEGGDKQGGAFHRRWPSIALIGATSAAEWISQLMEGGRSSSWRCALACDTLVLSSTV